MLPKGEDSKVVCWYCEKKGHRASDCRKKQRDHDKGQSKGSKKGDSRGKGNNKEFKGNCCKCGNMGHTSKDCRSKEASAFVASEEGLAETCCVDMASIDLNALEIGVVQLSEGDRKIRIGSDSCAAVTVFPKTVADDYPMLQTPGKAKSCRPSSGKLLPDLAARKLKVKLKDGSLRHVNPRVADTHRALMAVSMMNDMGHDVFFPRSDRGIKAYAYHEGQWLERLNGVVELPVEFVPYSESTSKSSNSGTYSSLSALEEIEVMTFKISKAERPKLTGACSAVSPTQGARLERGWSLSSSAEVLEVTM